MIQEISIKLFDNVRGHDNMTLFLVLCSSVVASFLGEKRKTQL